LDVTPETCMRGVPTPFPLNRREGVSRHPRGCSLAAPAIPQRVCRLYSVKSSSTRFEGALANSRLLLRPHTCARVSNIHALRRSTQECTPTSSRRSHVVHPVYLAQGKSHAECSGLARSRNIAGRMLPV
jgi:hypothetical protein